MPLGIKLSDIDFVIVKKLSIFALHFFKPRLDSS